MAINNVSWQMITSDMLIESNYTGFENVSVDMLLGVSELHYYMTIHILICPNSNPFLTHSGMMFQNVITKNCRLTYCFSKGIRPARGKNRLLLDSVGHCQQAYYI